VERLLDDDAGFARFARVLRGDLEAGLARGDRPRGSRGAELFDLAVLDALDGDWERADRRVREMMALADEPVAKLMTGLTIPWCSSAMPSSTSPRWAR
jgi:hypothetical protein